MVSGGTDRVLEADLDVAVCLEFANTVAWHAADEPEERLTSYADLLAWGQAQGILSPEAAGRLRWAASRRPAAAAATLAQAVGLREAIYRAFVAASERREPDVADLATLNAALAQAVTNLQIVPAAGGYRYAWGGDEDALGRMLWPVARAAAELLTGDELSRVRQCANHPCGWLFVDRSRARSRRWCDMASCGNRVKARRHHARRRRASDTESG